jgi:hypothetical protein
VGERTSYPISYTHIAWKLGASNIYMLPNLVIDDILILDNIEYLDAAYTEKEAPKK